MSNKIVYDLFNGYSKGRGQGAIRLNQEAEFWHIMAI